MVLSELCRFGAAGAGVPPPRTAESDDAPDGDEPLALPRAERRAGALALVDEPAGADVDESEEPEPAEPAEPVVSANASGIAARPEPTPRATANAPTRPTYFAKRGAVTDSTRRPYSMARTAAFGERRSCMTDFDSGIVAPSRKQRSPCPALAAIMPVRVTHRQLNRSNSHRDVHFGLGCDVLAADLLQIPISDDVILNPSGVL